QGPVVRKDQLDFSCLRKLTRPQNVLDRRHVYSCAQDANKIGTIIKEWYGNVNCVDTGTFIEVRLAEISAALAVVPGCLPPFFVSLIIVRGTVGGGDVRAV